MKEQQMQFRVGLFAIVAFIAVGAMIFQFSDIRELWAPKYQIVVHFDAAPGVYASTPVRRNGIAIGSVSRVAFDEKNGGVLVLIEVREQYRLRADAIPKLSRTILGDSSIEFVPGKSPEILKPGALLRGEQPIDPMDIVNNVELQLADTMQSFQSTSQEWEKLAQNVNSLLDTNRGSIATVLERAVVGLDEFATTMNTLNRSLTHAENIFGDQNNQENIRRTLEELPRMVGETRQAIAAVRSAVEMANQNLTNLNNATEPLAQHSTSIVTRLDMTLANMNSLSSELNDFSKLLLTEDGTLQRFASDPTLYRSLTQSADSMTVVMKNIEPVVRDLHVFMDKVARHPELLGVGGALRPSSGIKHPSEASGSGTVLQSSGQGQPRRMSRQ